MGLSAASVEVAGGGDRPSKEGTQDLVMADCCADKQPSCRKRKHKMRSMARPMAIPHVILEFFHEDLRECALRALSTFLLERREGDPENYARTGFLVVNSCATMCILLQEVLDFYRRMISGTFNPRSIKRVANVLTIFQCIAANPETGPKFIDYNIPSYLIPIIFFQSTVETFDDIRAMALSVIGILCQGQEMKSILCALENDIVKVCCTVMENGNELSKLVAMHILESILSNEFGIVYMCHPVNEKKLRVLTDMWNQMVAGIADCHCFSPRLLFHVTRCYAILCMHPRGLAVAEKSLPGDIINRSFDGVTEEFPVIRNLLDQLLLCVGKYSSQSSVAQETFGGGGGGDDKITSKPDIDCKYDNRVDFFVTGDSVLNRVIFVPVSSLR